MFGPSEPSQARSGSGGCRRAAVAVTVAAPALPLTRLLLCSSSFFSSPRCGSLPSPLASSSRGTCGLGLFFPWCGALRCDAVRLSPSMIKLREEADPFSMDLGVLKSGEVVKVLEVRLARRGGNEGMLITLD